MWTAQSTSTLGGLTNTCKRQSRHELVIGNWDITSRMGKEHGLVEKAKRHSLDVVGISSTKGRGSNTVELDDGWKLSCTGVEPAKFTQAEVRILVRPQLVKCVDEWIPLGERVCMLTLKLLDRSVCLIQAYAQNASALFPEFVNETSDVLRRVKVNESTIYLEDFNAHVVKDAGVWRGVVGRHGDVEVSKEGFYCNCAVTKPCAQWIPYSRGHQHGARRHQVASTDHVGLPRACSDNRINMIRLLILMKIFNFY